MVTIINSNQNNQEKDWGNIHEDFKFKDIIPRGKANNIGYWNKSYWQNKWFNYEQTEAWIKVGLLPKQANLAAYLRLKGIRPQKGLEFKKLEKEYITWVRGVKEAEDYLNYSYPPEIRKKIKIIGLKFKNLTGILDLSDFSQLEELYLDEGNKLDLLDISNNPHLACLKVNSKLFTENRIIGLEETSLIIFRLIACNLEYKHSPDIWNILIRQQQVIFPEMELIDIEDLNELANKIPDDNDEWEKKTEFLKKFLSTPFNPRDDIKIDKYFRRFALKGLIRHVISRCIIVRELLLNRKKVEYWWIKEWASGENKIGIPDASPYKTSQELTKKVLFGEDIELLKLLQDLEYLNPKYKIPNDTTYFTQWIDNLKQEGKVRRMLEKKLKEKEEKNEELKEELQIEREESEKALQKAQEWRERQLKAITDQKDEEIAKLKKENANLRQQLNNQQAQIEAKPK